MSNATECVECGRGLTGAASVKRGVGPGCWANGAAESVLRKAIVATWGAQRQALSDEARKANAELLRLMGR